MISKDSPLARLPTGLSPTQRGWLEGLRYAFDIFGTAAGRLHGLLHILAFQKNTREVAELTVADPFTTAITDAWSVIDAAWRLKRFLIDSRLPPSIGSPAEIKDEHRLDRKEFSAAIASIKKMRDGFQHLDNYAPRDEELGQSVWGTLRWVALHPSRKSMQTCVLVPGTPRHQGTTNSDFANPLGLPFHGHVDHVSLDAFAQKVDISRIVRATAGILTDLERILIPQFEGHPSSMNGFMVCATIKGSGENEESSILEGE